MHLASHKKAHCASTACKRRLSHIGAFLAAFAILTSRAASPARGQASTPAPVAAATAATPSPAVAAVIADAQAQVKNGKYAEAVAALMTAQTPGLTLTDRQAMDFTTADTQQAWGRSLTQSSQDAEALGHLNAALALDQRYTQRLAQQGNDMLRIGIAWMDQDQNEKAIEYFGQALAIDRQAKDRDAEAKALVDTGIAYDDLSQRQKAIDFYLQALPIYRHVKDREGEAGVLTNLGISYRDLSQYEMAIVYYGQALPIFREVKNLDGEAAVLKNMGIVYASLSQDEKAIDYFRQALPIDRQVKNRDGEAKTLMDLGNAYDDLSQHEKAVGYFEEALPIYRQVKDRDGEADALLNTGIAYIHLSQFEKTIGFGRQALLIYRQVKDRDSEANALGNLGTAYEALSQHEKAILYFGQALPIYRQVKDRNGEADVLYNLMATLSNAQNPKRNPGLATLFGKQAVNVQQSIRAGIHGMDKQTQKGYAKSKESTYRDLADLLIAQHRLPEALQVLDLLKQEEYLNFSPPTPGKPAASTALALAQAADLTPREQRGSATLAKAGNVLAEDSATVDEFALMQTPTPQQIRQQTVLTPKITADEAAYQKTLAYLSSAFPKKSDNVLDRLASTTNSRQLQLALSRLGDGSVAVYTLVIGTKLRVLLVTPKRMVARDVALKNATDLDKKIVAFRAILQDPRSDPKPLGEQLYDLLIAPIKHDLDRAHAKTLLMSLDGNLRYIPLAALSPDGKHYLVEKYRTALYTPAAIANLTRTPKPKWTALAMGVSEAPEGFAPLKAVPAELRSIVRPVGSPAGPNAGLYHGTTLLNAKFTRLAMVSALGKDYPLVHIASHFVFTGEETTSFLLLGDGAHLTLTDLKNLPKGVFAGVNLLTLSACETATGGIAAKGADNGNGSRDVENVAVLAQRKGADAVLASLWSVSDESTGLLMRTFYRDRQSGGPGGVGESKAEALRQAQLALLSGSAKTTSNALRARRSELLSPSPTLETANAPAFVVDPAKPWSHPYYWAPFILIGNWK